ncbi:MAG TPA: hypothetical protein VJ727_11210 [Rhodanobacteraceae bacterium]|nr:hypothetical protein [Rhodanobacteraceae bacterium]
MDAIPSNEAVIYRIGTGWRVFFCLSAIGFAALTGGVLWINHVPPHHIELMMDAVYLGLDTVFLWGALYALCGRLELGLNEIKLVKPLWSRKMAYEEIKGRRIIHGSRGAYYLRLISKSGGGMTIDMPFRTDQRFLNWANSLPDLDERGELWRG